MPTFDLEVLAANPHSIHCLAQRPPPCRGPAIFPKHPQHVSKISGIHYQSWLTSHGSGTCFLLATWEIPMTASKRISRKWQLAVGNLPQPCGARRARRLARARRKIWSPAVRYRRCVAANSAALRSMACLRFGTHPSYGS